MQVQGQQRRLAFTAKVMEVFSDIQKNPSIHKTQIFQLVKYSQEDANNFMYAFEQSYLKIFHSFHSKTNKKIPTKFQNLAQSFFEAVLPKTAQALHSLPESDKALEVFNSFLLLCTEGIYSSVMNIRIMCARLTFMLVKLIPARKMNLYLGDQVEDGIINSTLHLLRTKVSTYRQLGIKLASLIMHVNSEKSENIEKQMFKILAIEDNEQIRKLVITNLTITTHNLEEVLVRLRDKNPQIRAIVAKKLQGQRFKLQGMSINNIYKLLYDGYGSKQILVKKECLRYFAMFFAPDHSVMEDQSCNKHEKFIRMFRPQILLLNPHLYHLFDELICDLIQEAQQYMGQYIRDSCQNLKRGLLTHQIIWLKNAINCSVKDISKIYEQFGPTGIDLSKVLQTLSNNNEIFAIFELLQLFGKQNMPDQIGRNKMFDSLKELLSKLAFSQVNPDYSNFKDSDICHIPQTQELVRKKLMLSYYDMPIISTSFDLIFQIGQAMKNLRPQHYEIQMKQVMAEWHNSDENTLYKEKQLLEKNIEQLIKRGDKSLLNNMKSKLEDIEIRIQHEKQKTRKVLMCISRLRYNCDLEMFMSIIKDELMKDDKANGLLLLGLYCLENNDKVSNFWGVFWKYIESQKVDGLNKNHLLVSLKIVIDFIVKFNCLGGNFSPEGLEDFSADMFMDTMVKLMLHEDPDVRILAIESLCRLLYHERVDKSNQTTYFLILILLWLETSTETVSAKSVHTVSIFIKSYMEKGNPYSLKLAQIFCQFFKVILKFHEEKKGINKMMIKYNLTMQEFIKRTIFTVMTIFKYHKESRNVIWAYNTQQSQIGPQEFLLLFFLRDSKIVPYLGKSILLCDFFEFCSLETLILVKKVIETLSETRRWKGQMEQSMKKLQSDIQIQISLKNSDLFNDHVVEAMETENAQKMKLLTEQSRYVHKNIEDRALFVKIDSQQSSEDDDSSVSEQLSESEEEEEQVKQSKQESMPESQQNRKRNSTLFQLEESQNEPQPVQVKSKPVKRGGRKNETNATPARSLRRQRN